MVKSKEEVRKLLAALGTTRDEIVDKLTDLKIRGYRCSIGSCPIAQYLHNHECGDIVSVSGLMNQGILYVGLYGQHDDNVRYEFGCQDMPQVLGLIEFISLFDSGAYKHLDARM